MTPRTRLALALGALAALAAPFVPPRLGSWLPQAELPLWETLAAQLAWGGIACGFALLRGGALRERLGLTRGSVTTAALAIAAAGTLALSGALQFALSSLALTPGTSLERLDTIVRATAPQSPWLVLLAFGIAPGFGEEILFRGAFQRSLASRLGAWAVPLAALGFGALHLDRVHSPAAFALGCYLGALALFGRTTWAPIFCHVVNNCAALLPELAGRAGLPAPGSWAEAGAWLTASGLALVVYARLVSRSPAERVASSD